MLVHSKDHRGDHRQTQTRSSMLHSHKETEVVAVQEEKPWTPDWQAAEKLRNYDRAHQDNQEG